MPVSWNQDIKTGTKKPTPKPTPKLTPKLTPDCWKRWSVFKGNNHKG